MALFFVVIFLSKALHDRAKLASFVPEAAMIIMVGMFVGAMLYIFLDGNTLKGDDEAEDAAIDDMAKSILSFSPTVFFVVLVRYS